jgi:hypothetical protein
MVARPWPFLLVIPCILVTFAAVGWTRDDVIEEEVYNLWVPKRSAFSKDKEYGTSVGLSESTITSFSAMAVSRDGTNLFTESRLEEVRARMVQVEATTVRGPCLTTDANPLNTTNSNPFLVNGIIRSNIKGT